MKDLTSFIKNEFIKKDVIGTVKTVESIEDVNDCIRNISEGEYFNIRFTSTHLKEKFIDKLTTIRPDASIINCNCSLDRFNENSFDSKLLVFNNIKLCKHNEIIETIKNYKSILIC